MKKIGIITINDYNNYGNRLQNYAIQETIKKKKYTVETIKNNIGFVNRNYLKRVINYVKYFLKKKSKNSKRKRNAIFQSFNKKIKFSTLIIDEQDINRKINGKYDIFIVGSDQVWNPKINRLKNIDLLTFADGNKRVSFSASFGVNDISEEKKEEVSKELKKFKAISVREDRGKEIVEELTGRTDVEVLVDPTMLLTAEEWDKVSKKPEQLKSDKKYILNYFLGKLSDDRKIEIERIAQENDCEIINILDEKSPFYQTGPSEFLYLEKNAFLICTDSFHSCVFAILYNRPFVVFERQEEGTGNMSSRIDTLLTKFKLKDRTFDKKITKENLEHDYSEAYKILEIEREKSKKFLEKALD